MSKFVLKFINECQDEYNKSAPPMERLYTIREDPERYALLKKLVRENPTDPDKLNYAVKNCDVFPTDFEKWKGFIELLRTVPRVPKDSVVMDMTKYIHDNICPSCQKPRVETSPGYEKYVQTTKERFGDMAAPFCLDCRRRFCDSCHFCHLPISLAFSNEVGLHNLRKMTLATEQPGNDHICTVCHNN
uniref:Uncharacterized protein n=1 Tax=viral metagenome TaxID=1070528 RepID=A0A6C0EMJ4_9ZZZZ